MNNFLSLKTKVMARIYFEYLKNSLMNYPDYFMATIFVLVSFAMISIQDVIHNIPKNNLSSIFYFFLIAIRDTSLIIQLLIGGFFLRMALAGIKMALKNLNLGWLPLKIKY